ncbi:peptide ABC transporter substrate-binding protein [Hathewaya limosa]|uniref:Oligopeptide transport system substrate-binding protein n=1 Tax=Hathewaya limosa TaxID=1536 RepID=A0ABU0JNA3_HATLI|nr:peptide ABC transporter substrate-binding protein [Hathewaya limosa]MDQ0478563.1 oligopeptide transport system substrate-binding protein [Hathewaya limosa]
MKSKKILSVILSMVLLGSSTMIGCGGGKKSDDKDAAAKGPDKDQYLNVLLGSEPKSLDGSKASDVYATYLLNEVSEGLARVKMVDGKKVNEPAGAEKWDISKDNMEWTFHLRDNKWSDGKPVTAQDYEYSLKRTLDPKTGSTSSYLLYPIKNAEKCNCGKAKLDEVGIKAVDDKTLKITLEKPTAYFIDLLGNKCMLPQRKDIVEKYKDEYGTQKDKLVYCGPFVLDNWVHNNKAELKKNENYWDAKNVKLQKITMKIMKQESSRMGELQTGAIDMANVSTPQYVDKFKKTGKFDITKDYDGRITYDFYNQKDKYFKNAKIRKAFALSGNREGVCKTLFKGLAEPATGFCPAQVQIGDEEFRKAVGENYLEKLKAENPDPKKLLIEGLKEVGADPDPAKMNVTMLQAGTDPSSKEFAEFDQERLNKKLGINLKIEYVEWPIFAKRTDDMDYQFAGMGMSGDYDDPMTYFESFRLVGGNVPTGWQNKQYDELLSKTSNTADNKERLKYFKEAEKLLLYDDCVVSPKVFPMRQTFTRKYVKGVIIKQFGPTEYKYAYTEGRDK